MPLVGKKEYSPVIDLFNHGFEKIMKVLALLEPWASMIVIPTTRVTNQKVPLKEWETRSFYTKVRGQVLIHASLGWKKYQRELMNTWPFTEYPITPQFGHIIGAVDIVEVITTEEWWRNRFNGESEHWQEQKHFGDFSEGRFAWKLENPILFREPLASKGQLGFWNRDDVIIMGNELIGI